MDEQQQGLTPQPVDPPNEAMVPARWSYAIGWTEVFESYPMISLLYPSPIAMTN